jgi:transcriptional regulator GlxA family with amidase domain
VLALHDSTAFVPIGLVDMLRKATHLAASMPSAQPRIVLEPVLVAGGRAPLVVGAGAVRIHCAATTRNVRRADIVLVPAIDPDVVEHLALNRDAVAWVRRMYDGGADVASACTGAFLLGEAGLLDGRTATTHWAFQELLAERYPRVRVRPEAIVVDEGRVCTAGGATSFLNLALYLVERWLGADVARASSRMFLVDVNKSPQTAYAILAGQKAHADAEILRAQELIEGSFARRLAVGDLARKVAMSRRTFVRRFTLAAGCAPREYLQRVKVEAAKRALESSRRPVGAIAAEIGYTDPVAFRKIFARLTGLTPADYRQRYGASDPRLSRGRSRARPAAAPPRRRRRLSRARRARPPAPAARR